MIISHGSPINVNERPKMVPEIFLAQAHEFLKLGFAVLIVERRGYGRSTEKYVEIVGDCEHRDNKASGVIASSDILEAVSYAQAYLPIDRNRIVLAGQSTGGFSSLFAVSLMHSGVKAIINFAGGRGAKGNNAICSQENLLDTFAFMGLINRVPTLWIYNENDQAFSPELAQKMNQAFTATGGNSEFFLLPSFGNDGHRLFGDVQGIQIWSPIVKEFLQKLF